MNNKHENHKLIQCYHCGNRGYLDISGNYHEHFIGPIFDIDNEMVVKDYEYTFSYYFLKCPVCKKPSICRRFSDMFGDSSEVIEYPRNFHKYGDVPTNIMKTFDDAIRSKMISSDICLVALRRTIEAICRDKLAKDGSLFVMINDLVTRGILPESVKEVFGIVRILGNQAAHFKNTNITKDELEIIIDFVDFIISYTYSIPARINEFKKNVIDKSNSFPANID